jgi:hypothetical protein
MAVAERSTQSEDVEWGVEANARLTGSVAAVLFVLLAIEGFTILEIGRLLGLHVFIGMMLLPLVLVKTATTGYRFARYYTGNPAYVRRGPPPLILRLLGPVVGVLTFAVLVTGVVLLWAPTSWQDTTLFLHKATFILWFCAMTVHVLGHLVDTYRLAPRDWKPQRSTLPRVWLRRATVLASLLAGIGLGVAALGQADQWLRR